jgi:hypothetical protein
MEGKHWLQVAAVIVVYMASLAAVFLTARMVYSSDAFEPLTYEVPQRVLTPVAQQGGTVEVEAVVCNSRQVDVAVRGSSFWRNAATGKLTPYVANQDNVISPGCLTRHFVNQLPPTLEAGRYQLEGIIVAQQGSKTQDAGWHTETFCVADDSRGGC